MKLLDWAAWAAMALGGGLWIVFARLGLEDDRIRALMRRSIVKSEPGGSSRVIAFATRHEVLGPKGKGQTARGT